jgi:hypothetical protein
MRAASEVVMAKSVWRIGPWAWLLALSVLAACGGGGGDEPTLTAAAPLQLDSPKAVTANVGVAGGSLTTTGTDGTRYTLTIPAHALRKDVAITLTPIAALGDLPAGASLAGGAHFGPEGQTFDVPVMLTVALAAAPARRPLPFTYTGNLQHPRRYPATVSGSTLTFEIVHFSGYGALAASLGDALGFFPPPSERGDQALQALVDATLLGLEPAVRDAAMRSALQGWLGDFIKPEVAALAALTAYDLDTFMSGRVARLANELRAFAVALKFALFEGSVDAFVEVQNAFQIEAVVAARKAIDLSTAGCPSLPNQAVLLIAPDILAWQELAQQTDATVLDESLERAAVLQALCVQPAFDAQDGVGFPADIQSGQQGLLTARAGYSINGGPVRFDLPMLVGSTGTTNVTPGTPEAVETGAGQTYARLFQWHGGTPSMRIDVSACFAEAALREVCKSQFVVRGGASSEPAVVMHGRLRAIATVGGYTSDSGFVQLLSKGRNQNASSPQPFIDTLDEPMVMPPDTEEQGQFRFLAQSSADQRSTDPVTGVVRGRFAGRVRASCTQMTLAAGALPHRENPRGSGTYHVSAGEKTGSRAVDVRVTGTLSRIGREDLNYHRGEVEIQRRGQTDRVEVTPFTVASRPIDTTFSLPPGEDFEIQIQLEAYCDTGLSYEDRVNEVEVSLTYTVTPN